MARIAISTSSFGAHDRAPLERLAAAGHEVVLNPHGRRLVAGEAAAFLAAAEGLIAGTERLDRATLEAAQSLRVISRCGVGTDEIDLEAAEQLGIEVRTTSIAHVDPVAELTLAGILATLRHLALADRLIRQGRWTKPMGSLLRGRTVGIVGLGRTGRRLAELLGPFDVRLLACDPRPDAAFAAAHDIDLVELVPLLEASDVVTLHVDASAVDGPLLDGDRLARMRPGALLINVARGGLVDESALGDALAAGRLGGAFLDVFDEEPYHGPLTRSDRVVLSPHLGSYAIEGRTAMEMESVENLLRALEAER